MNITHLICTDREQHAVVDLGYMIIDRRGHMPGSKPSFESGSHSRTLDENGEIITIEPIDPRRLRHDGDMGVTYQLACPECRRTPRRREENLLLTYGAVLDRLYKAKPGHTERSLDISYMH